MTKTFNKNDVVLHVKTNGQYIITGTPSEFIMLSNPRTVAYAYKKLVPNGENKTFIRSQKEMEDGRFMLCIPTKVSKF